MDPLIHFCVFIYWHHLIIIIISLSICLQHHHLKHLTRFHTELDKTNDSNTKMSDYFLSTYFLFWVELRDLLDSLDNQSIHNHILAEHPWQTRLETKNLWSSLLGRNSINEFMFVNPYSIRERYQVDQQPSCHSSLYSFAFTDNTWSLFLLLSRITIILTVTRHCQRMDYE